MVAKSRREDFERGGRCEVKMRGATGEVVWRGGRVNTLNGNGAYVKIDEGPTNFFWYADMRAELVPPKAPDPPRMPKPERPLATIGDAIAARKEPMPPAEPPKLTVAPPPPEPAPVKSRPYVRRRHQPSEVGTAFRNFRLKEGVAQKALADLLDTNASKLSLVECGSSLPDDALIERFATLSGIPIESLRAMRARSSAIPQAAAPETQPSPPPASMEAAPAPGAMPTDRNGLEEFIERLDDLVAMPADKEARRRWFAIARELHAMAGES